jgi:hypothetical protein
MNRNKWLALLVCINVMLLAAIVLCGTTPRTAVAQSGGLADNYLMISGQIQSDRDALYVLDMQTRALHAFAFTRGTRELEWAGSRLLEQDFRHNRN